MRTRFHFILTAFSLSCFLFTACGGDKQPANEENKTATETTAAETPPPAEIKLTDFTPSPDFPDATISMDYKDGKFMYKVGGTSYKLGEQTPDAPQKMCANSGEGQHIHLIIDNEPYIAKYTPQFEQDVADGEHYILSFLSRSYHESIKTDKAHTAVKAEVKNKSFVKATPIKDPMLFYSRPKGKYTGKAETDKVMLDFYPVNCTLSADGYKVRVSVNNEKDFIINRWTPYFLEGLPMGDNKIKLTLIDKDGNPVNTPLNPVERVFTLVADPAPGQ
ncbi:MAG: hypothetical protein R2830_12410 [Saprospiraceae bacterium]